MFIKMKKLLKTSVIALLLVALNITPVFAITEADRSSVNLDTVYYDPNSCDDSGGTTVAATSSKTGVYLVGDKITSMSKAEIQKQVKGIVMSNDDFREVKNAVDVLNDDKDKVAKVGTVIIELGTWGRLDGGEIEKVIKKVKEINKDATIYWVDVIKGVSHVNAEYNKKIYSKQSEGYKVISWFKTVYPDNDPQKDEGDLKDNKKLLDDDTGNVFPNEAGQKALASTIASNIGASGAVSAGASCGCGVAASAGSGLANVPEPWRSLILNAAATTDPKLKNHVTGVDPRLVAATLWIENRSWPDFNKKWNVSPMAAAGPWQFIPSTWASMGADGDGDGKKDPNNPKDAVYAAFMHQKGSAGKPIMENFNGDIEAGLNLTLVIDRLVPKNLLTYMAKYNGRGAPVSAKLKDYPNNENSNYVKMAYYLLASDFTKAWVAGPNKFIDPRTGDKAGGTTASSGANCATGAEVVGNVVFYSQIDPRWKNDAFGKTSSTIGSSGCGVTSFAMVAATLTGNNSITPKEISKLWGEKGWALAGGTSWAAFEPNGAAKEYGLKAETIFANQGSHFNQNTIDKITAALRAGKLVIASGDHKTSTLFTGPHIIVIRGVTADGKFLVNDPKDDPKLKQQTSKQWDKSVLMAEAYAAWAFSK